MRYMNQSRISWLLIVSVMILAMPMFMLADDSATDIEKVKQLRQLQNRRTVLNNVKNNSVATKATPAQERMLRLSNALTKAKQNALPNLESEQGINLRRTERSLPRVQTNALRDVFMGSGAMSFHPDSLFFNFLTGENSGDSTGMDVRITSNEMLNFGNEYVNYADPSLLYYLSPSSSLDQVSEVDPIDHPVRLWTDISWDWSGGNSGAPLMVGDLWVVYTRTSHMYVVLEVTEAVADWQNPSFSFDYMIQTDGTPLFDGTPSLYDMTVNGNYTAQLEIGSNPYFEITLDGHSGGEFAVIWDGNHNGMLDEGDVGLEYYPFMDNDMHDEDPTPGIFGFTYSDDMADGINYLADDLLFVASSGMDMAVTSVHFYANPSPYFVSGSIYETNGGGAPLAGIVVWAVYETSENDDRPSVIVVTDAAGQYHLDLPDTGFVVIGSEDHFGMTDGLMPDPPNHFVHVQGGEFGFNFYYVAPTSGIEGFVYDEMGNAVEGVEVTVDGDGGPGRSSFTNSAGYYYIGVMPGEYDVNIRLESLPDSYIVPFGEYVYVGDFAVTTVNFTLHTTNNFIVGVVTLDGEYFEGATIVAMNEFGYIFTMSTTNGYFELPVYGGPETFYELMAWMPDMSNIIQVSDNHNVPAGAEGVGIVLETVSGGMYGYFIDTATNQPILGNQDFGMMMRDVDTGMEFYSGPDHNGYYEIYVPSGLYEVMAGGYEWIGPAPDSVFIGEDLIPHDFYLTHMTFDASLEGFVFDQNGVPVPYAQVQIGNESWGAGMMTDQFGHYYFDLPVGYYYVSAWADGYYMYFDELVVGPGFNNYNFFLEQYQVDGAIFGMVYEEMTGAPIQDANVYAYSWDDNESYWTYTDGDGVFWFDLPNGTYDVVVEHWDYPPMWIDGVTVQNDTTELFFPMVLPDGGVEGHVFDDQGYPIYGAEVVIISDLDSLGYWGYTDGSGYYSIPAMNGQYHILAGAPGFEHSQPSAFTINHDWVNIDIYLQPREFATAPQINFIVDQPFDQGRWVRMQFWPGGTEWGPFMGYSVWRLSNTPMGPILDFVEYLPNHEMEAYNLVLPTLVDSSAMVSDPLEYMTAFMVTGHWDMYGFIDGEPAAGYSVDNIHPGIPGPLTLLSASDQGVEIGWEMSMDDDFQYFEVYRATNPDFTNANVYATVEPNFSDQDVTIGQTYFYAVSAVDANGNMSETTNVVSTSIVSVDDLEMIPAAYGLSQNYPNPFNPTTTIQFALPEASEVSLVIYNLLGQKVRTLVNGYVPAGYINTSWDGLDQNGKEIGSGTYIYRLQTADQTFSKKMVLMK
jgi:hypothetical protein